MTRADVRKTYKLYIGGAFPRSESGHTYVVNDAKGKFLANAALASRKDARDAVVAARAAFGGWSGRTAYNRAQVVYRIAELMEDRRPQFVDALVSSEGLTARQASAALDAAIDRLVWYAGWADKLTQVVGNANPVAGPFFNLSTPEPTGVVAVLAPQESSLLGLISVVAPVIVSGNTCVVVSSYARPLPAVTFSEVLATSDVPGGVVNILTGDAASVGPWLASHMDVNAHRPGRRGRLVRARRRARGRGGRQPQAGTPGAGVRAGLDRRAGAVRDDGLPRDQDGLAPDRRLGAPPARRTAARTCSCEVRVSTATVTWVTSSPSRWTTTLVWPTPPTGSTAQATTSVAEPVGRDARRRPRRTGRGSGRACRSWCGRGPRRTPARPRGGSRGRWPRPACRSRVQPSVAKTRVGDPRRRTRCRWSWFAPAPRGGRRRCRPSERTERDRERPRARVPMRAACHGMMCGCRRR